MPVIHIFCWKASLCHCEWWATRVHPVDEGGGEKSASASCFTILIPHSAGLQEIHLGALRAYNKKLLML
jgi:hypothetical protein